MNLELTHKVKVGEVFSVCIPKDFKVNYIEQGETIEIQGGPLWKPIYIKKYRNSGTKLTEFLDTEVRRFVEEGMRPQLGSEFRCSIEQGQVGDLLYSQAVAQVTLFDWWIARTIGKESYPYYFLIHWIGNRSDLTTGIAIFASFTLMVKTGARN